MITCKKAKLDEVLLAHCGVDLVTEWYEKENKILILSGDFRCLFWPKVNGHFRFLPEMEFHFRRHFCLRPKMKNGVRSASSIHHKQVLVLRSKVLVLILNCMLNELDEVLLAHCGADLVTECMKKKTKY